MYRVQWDADTGGVLLTDEPEGLDGEMRPVFHEELDLLGFEQGGWTYPRVEDGPPLLWAVGRRYFYRGELVAEAKGGGFLEKPVLQFVRRDLVLTPVDLPAMIQRNAQHMAGLVFRALEFIRREYEARRDRVDIAAVAFSGGKDSLTLLDLVQRALPPDCFEVVFNDTTMELSVTYEAVARAKARWPGLRFHTARPRQPAQESWDDLGPPSRVLRWCCTVLKSGPTLQLLRQLTGTVEARVLIWDGCRAGEGARRSAYSAVSVGAKHITQTNVSPLLQWSAIEVFLYLFDRNILFNRGYRHGFARVGCAVCPLASNWWDSLAWDTERARITPFTERLRALAVAKGVSNDQLDAYICGGGWRGRMGGQDLPAGGNRVILSDDAGTLVVQLRDPRGDWLDWATVLGDVSVEGPATGRLFLATHSISCHYHIEEHGRHQQIRIEGMTSADRFARRDLKAVFYKAAYCVGCEACVVECPTGALAVNGKPRIDKDRCVACGQCLTFVEKGCWAAKSLAVTESGAEMKLRTYQHFGMRKSWLAEFLANPTTWWHSNSLGNRQFEAMRGWLADGGVLASNRLTPLGERLQKRGVDDPVCWLALWTNLCERSTLISWYVRDLPWGAVYSREELVAALPSRFAESTRQNGVRALVSLLRDTPLGSDLNLGHIAVSGSRMRDLTKQGLASPPNVAVLYSLMCLATRNQRWGFSIEEVVQSREGGPVLEMGVSPDSLKSTLRGLASRYPQWIRLELVHDLDNLYLEPTLSPEGALDLE